MKKVIFVMILILPFFSFAAEKKKERDISDYNVFNDALEAKGIDYFTVDWMSVNSSCDFYKEEGDNEYNQCRLKRAEENKNFISDRNTCDQKAFNSYPDALTTGSEEHVIKEIDGKEEREIRILKKMSANELSQRRKAYYVSCMSNFGWRDANNWLSGSR